MCQKCEMKKMTSNAEVIGIAKPNTLKLVRAVNEGREALKAELDQKVTEFVERTHKENEHRFNALNEADKAAWDLIQMEFQLSDDDDISIDAQTGEVTKYTLKGDDLNNAPKSCIYH